MFAGTLNKGFRGALLFLISFFVIGAAFSFFAFKGAEVNRYPDLFYTYFSQSIQNRLLITLLNYLFIALGVFLITLIGINQEIVEKQNYFPVFLYLIISMACIQPDAVNAQLFTNIFILFFIYKLLDSYRNEESFNRIFIAAFWISFSAFLTVSSISCFPLFFITLIILRSFSWREWAVALLGFLSPVFIIECIAYLSDFERWYFIKAVYSYFSALKFPSFSEYYLPLTIILVILLLLSLFSFVVNGLGNTVKKQRAKSVIFWYIFLCTPVFFAGQTSITRVLLTYAFPFSFFIGDFLFGIKQIKITNTLLVLLFACLIIIFLGQYRVI